MPRVARVTEPGRPRPTNAAVRSGVTASWSDSRAELTPRTRQRFIGRFIGTETATLSLA